MSLRTGPHEHHRRNARGGRCVDLKRATVAECIRSHIGDSRPDREAAIGVEQIRRGIDLYMLFVRAARRVSTGQHDGGVRKEERAGMVQTRIHVAARRSERVRGRIVEVGPQARCRRVFVVGRSAKRQHFAVRQDRRVHLNPRLRHRRAELPQRSGG